MYGGVGGAEPRGSPLSRSLALRDGSLRRGDTSAVGAKPEVRGAHSRRRPKATSAVKTKIVMFECLPWSSRLSEIGIEQIGVCPINVRERHARLQLDVLGSPVVANHQCACSTASTVVIPAIREPVIAISAGMPRGNSRLISDARKIAATGRAMTK